ncbi:hypothetical protein Cva_00679 [Caedimonas varicaedens]|jgi:hypothetical protein|uniref:Uncharacterized protein n=1 Tax=Caedimonas varicaedens TaxID=1629334 RepID=A0A0K8MC08_9PROT|nr:hypothetical protein Cva_00679 [Caedimonas varicaedens]
MHRNHQKEKLFKPWCGLCGSTEKRLTKTECCQNWICDDAHTYQVFSYANNSCYRNHDCYTLCAAHYHEGHTGRWQDCQQCRDSFDVPYYTYCGTNKYNFDVLNNPEKYTISCTHCDFRSHSIEDFPYQTSKGYYCGKKKCQHAFARQ